ncbi:hypothetical protein RHMOL_Rhmol04G0085800 [Rhododendron molle]|uniref:Uncharacterized protein n=1 Tax=Rhododendron molle TaxID=49168 RepID=A0ACC0NYB1_RHOML|nr:hypothetical protein RHMOL_Rhmol04G0085800 [Rhododendron molle]
MDCEDLVLEEDQNLDEVPEPKVGMFFDSEDDARDYYGRYAEVQGFVVVTRTSNKRRNGQKTNITYSCHRKVEKQNTKSTQSPSNIQNRL